MSSPLPNKRRMDTDVIKLIESKRQVTLISAGKLNEFMVKFPGPPNTPYEGGIWDIHVYLPDEYPYKSPSIGFKNRIYHPNIHEKSGSVCLDVINQMWTPMYDLANVFESFLPQLLAYPNPTDPLNADAAKLFLHKPDDYISKVKEFVKLYAIPEPNDDDQTDDNDDDDDDDDGDLSSDSNDDDQGLASTMDLA